MQYFNCIKVVQISQMYILLNIDASECKLCLFVCHSSDIQLISYNCIAFNLKCYAFTLPHCQYYYISVCNFCLFRMAPEVIRCETLKDTPYDYKADIWSLGEQPHKVIFIVDFIVNG